MNIFLAVIKLLYPSTQHPLGQTDHPLPSVRSLSAINPPSVHAPLLLVQWLAETTFYTNAHRNQTICHTLITSIPSHEIFYLSLAVANKILARTIKVNFQFAGQ